MLQEPAGQPASSEATQTTIVLWGELGVQWCLQVVCRSVRMHALLRLLPALCMCGVCQGGRHVSNPWFCLAE